MFFHSPCPRALWPALLALAGPGALAAPPAVVDPAAPVPPVVYRSVFADLPQGVETGATDWRRANDEVGRYRRGHIDILKAEEAEEGAQRVSPPSNPAGTHRHGARP